MNEMNVTQALLKAILELIEKCETLEELRESAYTVFIEAMHTLILHSLLYTIT